MKFSTICHCENLDHKIKSMGNSFYKKILYDHNFYIIFQPLNSGIGNEREKILESMTMRERGARNNKKLFMEMLGTISHNLFMCVCRGEENFLPFEQLKSNEMRDGRAERRL